MTEERKNALNDIRRHSNVTAYVIWPLILILLISGITLQKGEEILPVIENIGGNKADIPATAVATESFPTQLRIPSLSIETSFEDPLGVNENQEIEVPDSFDQVGWYQHGPTPGEQGPAVVLGHVDSREGPAVFFPLGQLNPGDSIFIDRDDETQLEFEVTALERYEQEGFPTDLVYGDIDHAGLRLVTCSGTYDRGEQRYTHNLIVYAALKDVSVEEEDSE